MYNIIVNIEHRLIQLCIFRRSQSKYAPVFFKNYLMYDNCSHERYTAKLDKLLGKITKDYQVEIAHIYFVFYDNHLITKAVSVNTSASPKLKINRGHFNMITKNLLSNSIIKKNYQLCCIWINSINPYLPSAEQKVHKEKVVIKISCDYLPKAEYKSICELTSLSMNNKFKVHLIPSSKAISAYFQYCRREQLIDALEGISNYYIVHILDNRIVVYAATQERVSIYRVSNFGVNDIINVVCSSLQISEKICEELFFSNKCVYSQFSQLKLLTEQHNKHVSIANVEREFHRVLYEQLLAIFEAKMKRVVIMGRSIESYLFWQFVNRHLYNIVIIHDFNVFLRQKYWIFFKLIGANYLLNQQERFFHNSR